MTQQAKKKWDWALKILIGVSISIISWFSIQSFTMVKYVYDSLKDAEKNKVTTDSRLAKIERRLDQNDSKNEQQDSRLLYVEFIMPSETKVKKIKQ